MARTVQPRKLAIIPITIAVILSGCGDDSQSSYSEPPPPSQRELCNEQGGWWIEGDAGGYGDLEACAYPPPEEAQ